MSDARWRDLERAAQAGDVAAGAELRRRQVRAQVITREQCELLAWVGDSASRAMLQQSPEPDLVDLEALVKNLVTWGRETLPIAAGAALQAVGSKYAPGTVPLQKRDVVVHVQRAAAVVGERAVRDALREAFLAWVLTER